MPETRVSPALHIALPGLCWPENTLRDLVFDLPLPALAALLGKATSQGHAVTDSTAWLGQLAGIEMSPIPVAALRLLALDQAVDGEWLCLDPVHLRVEKTQLIVTDPAELQLDATEADALAASLRPVLEELGDLHPGTATNWHLRCHAESHLRTTPLPDAIGLNADILMPQADNVRVWRRALNEVQMTLHSHPVNAARSARGLPTVNSLWPWGEGKLPQASPAPWTLLCANGLLWKGVARHLGCAHQSEPARHLSVRPEPVEGQSAVHNSRSWFDPSTGSGLTTNGLDKTLVISDILATAERAGDAMRWRDGMQALEKNWFAPMLAAWQAGELREVGIHGNGAGQGMSFVIRGIDRWRFWRKPAALTVLGAKETEGPSPSLRT